MDGCYSSPCLNNGICLSDKYGSYNCTCPNGFVGSICQYRKILKNHSFLNNLNYKLDFACFYLTKIADGCYSHPCLNGGKCTTDANGNYNCTCIIGFYGVNCQFCKYN